MNWFWQMWVWILVAASITFAINTAVRAAGGPADLELVIAVGATVFAIWLTCCAMSGARRPSR